MQTLPRHCQPVARGFGTALTASAPCRRPQAAFRNCRVSRPCQRVATSTAESEPDSPAQLRSESAHAQDQSETATSKDVDRPRYHIGAPRGWVNDPNAPLLFDGTYHLFFQHLPDSTEWQFGLTWGHVASTDLVHWAWLPIALEPTKGGFDADGCFSGSAVLDTNGTPTILYTGVRLRNNPDAPPPPDAQYDLGLPMIETQLCAAHSDPKSDPLLKQWTKDESSSIELPPSEDLHAHPNTLMGWRDPFIFEMPSEDNNQEYGMFIGNGVKDKGGTVLVYRSKELTSGWRFTGTLCSGKKEESGSMWECPILLPLQPDDNTSDGQPSAIIGSMDACHAQDYTHVFFVSPDAPSQSVLYWLGKYEPCSSCPGGEGRFLIDDADGPFRLDLGDAPYAPNTLVNDDGRHLMWCWIQEHPSRADNRFNYAGCMSCPRELHIRNGRLVQKPLRELDTLHSEHIFFQEEAVEVHGGRMWPVPSVSVTSMDVRFTMHPGGARKTGLAILDDSADEVPRDAAIVYDWDEDRLEVAYNTFLAHPDRTRFSLSTEAESEDAIAEESHTRPRSVGGKLGWCRQEPLKVRVLFDGSCVEVFAGLSHDDVARGVLSTRIYRGAAEQPGLAFFAVGGSASVSDVDVWEMDQMWSDRGKIEAEAAKPCQRNNKQTRPAEKAVDMPWGQVNPGRCKMCMGLHRAGECPLAKDGKDVHHPHGEGNT